VWFTTKECSRFSTMSITHSHTMWNAENYASLKSVVSSAKSGFIFHMSTFSVPKLFTHYLLVILFIFSRFPFFHFSLENNAFRIDRFLHILFSLVRHFHLRIQLKHRAFLELLWKVILHIFRCLMIFVSWLIRIFLIWYRNKLAPNLTPNSEYRTMYCEMQFPNVL